MLAPIEILLIGILMTYNFSPQFSSSCVMDGMSMKLRKIEKLYACMIGARKELCGLNVMPVYYYYLTDLDGVSSG